MSLEFKPPGSGVLITFEGIDYCGKSTQARKMIGRLQNESIDAVLLRDPGTTKISEKIREILLDRHFSGIKPWTELLLYEAARAQMVEQSIKPALVRGSVVICDRFYDSTTAYQGYGRRLDLERVRQANAIGACGLVPSLTFYIDLEPDLAAARMKSGSVDRIESEGPDFQSRVRSGFLRIAAEEPQRVRIIDGARPVEQVGAEIWAVTKSYLKRMSYEKES